MADCIKEPHLIQVQVSESGGSGHRFPSLCLLFSFSALSLHSLIVLCVELCLACSCKNHRSSFWPGNTYPTVTRSIKTKVKGSHKWFAQRINGGITHSSSSFLLLLLLRLVPPRIFNLSHSITLYYFTERGNIFTSLASSFISLTFFCLLGCDNFAKCLQQIHVNSIQQVWPSCVFDSSLVFSVFSLLQYFSFISLRCFFHICLPKSEDAIASHHDLVTHKWQNGSRNMTGLF